MTGSGPCHVPQAEARGQAKHLITIIAAKISMFGTSESAFRKLVKPRSSLFSSPLACISQGIHAQSKRCKGSRHESPSEGIELCGVWAVKSQKDGALAGAAIAAAYVAEAGCACFTAAGVEISASLPPPRAIVPAGNSA